MYEMPTWDDVTSKQFQQAVEVHRIGERLRWAIPSTVTLHNYLVDCCHAAGVACDVDAIIAGTIDQEEADLLSDHINPSIMREEYSSWLLDSYSVFSESAQYAKLHWELRYPCINIAEMLLNAMLAVSDAHSQNEGDVLGQIRALYTAFQEPDDFVAGTTMSSYVRHLGQFYGSPYDMARSGSWSEMVRLSLLNDMLAKRSDIYNRFDGLYWVIKHVPNGEYCVPSAGLFDAPLQTYTKLSRRTTIWDLIEHIVTQQDGKISVNGCTYVRRKLSLGDYLYETDEDSGRLAANLFGAIVQARNGLFYPDEILRDERRFVRLCRQHHVLEQVGSVDPSKHQLSIVNTYDGFEKKHRKSTIEEKLSYLRYAIRVELVGRPREGGGSSSGGG